MSLRGFGGNLGGKTLAFGTFALLSSTYMSTAVKAETTAPLKTKTTRASEKQTNGKQSALALSHMQKALDLLAQGDTNRARAEAEKAHRLAGDSPEINFLLTYLLEREGRMVEAQASAQSVARMSPLNARYAEQLAQNGSGNRVASTKMNFFAPAEEMSEESFVDGVPTRMAQTQHNLAILEKAMVVLVNRERAARGLNELQIDATLADTARAHSADMRDRNYFAHEAPTQSLRAPLDRYLAVFNTEPRVVAENLYNVWGGPRKPSQTDIVEAQRKLMESPGHRANILLEGVTNIGIGIVSNANGDLWLTQMFSQPGK